MRNLDSLCLLLLALISLLHVPIEALDGSGNGTEGELIQTIDTCRVQRRDVLRNNQT